jgi:putative ABC transport system permease protein
MVALRNVCRNRIRSALTLLGVAAGISVFVSSLSVSNGFKTQIQDVIKSHSIDLTVQARGAATPITSRIPIADYYKLHEIPGVSALSSVVLGSIRTAWNSYFIIAGISSDEALLGRFGMVEGRSFIPGRREVILGELAAKRLGYSANTKILLTENEMFSVAGIYSLGNGVLDGAAILDISDARRLLKSGEFVNIALVRLEKGAEPKDVIENIQQRFPNMSALRSGDFAGQIRMLNTVDLFVWVISAISLFTCCMVVMNTLFMATFERTREIGILMAIGWGRFMIIRTIMYEATIICVGGGLLGNALGLVSLWVLSKTSVVGLGWIPTFIPFAVTIKSIILSLVLGVVSSLCPAVAASKLLPAEALRYE